MCGLIRDQNREGGRTGKALWAKRGKRSLGRLPQFSEGVRPLCRNWEKGAPGGENKVLSARCEVGGKERNLQKRGKSKRSLKRRKKKILLRVLVGWLGWCVCSFCVGGVGWQAETSRTDRIPRKPENLVTRRQKKTPALPPPGKKKTTRGKQPRLLQENGL